MTMKENINEALIIFVSIGLYFILSIFSSSSGVVHI